MSTATWTSATSVGTTLALGLDTDSYVAIGLEVTSPLFGIVSFEVSPEGTTWYPLLMQSTSSAPPSTTAIISGTSAWELTLAGWADVRVRLSNPITGNGNVVVTLEVNNAGGGGGGGAVSSVFGRTGAVVATSGDYVAAQVTNAADTSSASVQSFTANVEAPALEASGLTGTNAPAYFAGATNSGAPTTGTWTRGSFIVDLSGAGWICTATGTPGTWVGISGAGVSSFNGRTGAVVPATSDYTAAQVHALPNPQNVDGSVTLNGTFSIPAIASYTIIRGTVTAATTITYPTATAGTAFTLIAAQNSTGGFALTFPTTSWMGATPDPQNLANEIDVYSIFYDGTEWVGLWVTGNPTFTVGVPNATDTQSALSGAYTLKNPATTGVTAFDHVLSGNVTYTWPTATKGVEITGYVDNTGGHTVTFPTTRWAGLTGPGSAPSVNGKFYFKLRCFDGTDWDGFYLGQVAGAGSNFDTTVLGFSPLLYWEMEDTVGTTTAADASGNGRTLSTTSFTFGETGIVPSDSFTCALASTTPASSSYKPALSNVSMMAVVQFTSTPGTTQDLYNQLATDFGGALRINVSGEPQVVMGNGTTTVIVPATASVTPDDSYLIVATWNGTTVTLYWANITTAGGVSSNTGSLAAGAGFGPTGNATINSGTGTSMYIGRVALFGTALSSGNVTTLYNAAI